MPWYCSDLVFFVGSNLLVFGFYWICLFVKGLFVHHSLWENVFFLVDTYCWVPFVFVAGCVWSAVKYLQIGFAPLSSAPSLWPSSYYGIWPVSIWGAISSAIALWLPISILVVHQMFSIHLPVEPFLALCTVVWPSLTMHHILKQFCRLIRGCSCRCTCPSILPW